MLSEATTKTNDSDLSKSSHIHLHNGIYEMLSNFSFCDLEFTYSKEDAAFQFIDYSRCEDKPPFIFRDGSRVIPNEEKI